MIKLKKQMLFLLNSNGYTVLNNKQLNIRTFKHLKMEI